MSIKEKPTEKKKVNDQGTFTKFPNIIFDECDLPETAQIIFMRLCRHVCHRNNVFIGSLRKLSKLVRISKSTVERMLPRLEETHYIKKEWDDEHKQMVIHVLMAPLWEQNKSRTEPTPDLGPHNSIIVPKWDTREINYLNYDAFVPEWDDLMEAVNNPVPKRDKFVPNWDKGGSNWDKSVPPSSSNVGTTTITTITTETTRESNAHVSDDNALTPSLSSSNSSPSITDEAIPSETPSFEQREATQPLSNEQGPVTPPTPEFASQREEEHVPPTAQSVGQSSEQAELPIVEGNTGGAPGKGSKAEKITQSQINHVYDVLEQMFRKAYDSPDYCIPRTETATRYIKSLIKAKATPVLVQKAFKKLWDQEDKNGEHWWREPGHLTIKAFVNQYTALAPSLMSAGQTNSSTPPAQEEPEKKSVLGVAGLPRVETNKPAPKVSYVPSSVQQQRQRMLGKRIS